MSKQQTRITLYSVVFVHGLFGDRQETWTKELGRHERTPDPDFDSLSQPHKNRPHSMKKWFSRNKDVIRQDHGASSEGGIANEGIQQPTSRPLKVFWPRDLLPRRFSNLRIFTWGYDVDIDHAFSGTSTATVFQHAANLLSDLSDVRVLKEAELRPLFFVAHSLGGIVVKDVSLRFLCSLLSTCILIFCDLQPLAPWLYYSHTHPCPTGILQTEETLTAT